MNFSVSPLGALLYETLRVGVGKASCREASRRESGFCARRCTLALAKPLVEKPTHQKAVACGKPLRVYDSFHNSNRIAVVQIVVLAKEYHTVQKIWILPKNINLLKKV
ncbi:MAG: hypothetical protein V7K92_16020 [Nostoc sp.]|uniref:hypothetical protein n=1 Tax=Nostoc sp. TaxID=1180 RepID=UPI002FEF2549